MVRAPYRVCPLGAHVNHQLGPATAMAIDRGVYLAYAPSPSGEVRLSSLDFPGVVQLRPRRRPAPAGRRLGQLPARGGPGASGPLSPGAWHRRRDGGPAARRRRQLVGGRRRGVPAGIRGRQRPAGRGRGEHRAGSPDRERVPRPAQRHPRPGGRPAVAPRASDADRLPHRRTRAYPGRARPAAVESSWPSRGCGVPWSGPTTTAAWTSAPRRPARCSPPLARRRREPVLGDVNADEYEAHRHLLRGAPARRAAHFFSEVERVRRGVAAWRAGDLAGFGALMTASGDSSIHNYECGVPPLIDLYHTLVATEGVHGARFCGAGFGGCCVAMVNPRAVNQAVDRVGSTYRRMHPDLAEHAAILVCDSADGAAIVDDARDKDHPGPPPRPARSAHEPDKRGVARHARHRGGLGLHRPEVPRRGACPRAPDLRIRPRSHARRSRPGAIPPGRR